MCNSFARAVSLWEGVWLVDGVTQIGPCVARTLPLATGHVRLHGRLHVVLEKIFDPVAPVLSGRRLLECRFLSTCPFLPPKVAFTVVEAQGRLRSLGPQKSSSVQSGNASGFIILLHRGGG